MGKRSYRHIILDPYAYSKHSILQQMQHFLATIQRMTDEVLVPNMLQGMQRPGWTNTDLLHMYQVLTQVDHLLRWGGARNESIKMEATFKFYQKPTIKNNNRSTEVEEVDDEEEDDEEDLDEEDEEEEDEEEESVEGSAKNENKKTSKNSSDLNKVLETLDRLSMDEASSGISSNAVCCLASNASARSEAKRKEDAQQSGSKSKDANNKAKAEGEDNFTFDSLVIRCRSCRSGHSSHSDQCKRCVRSLMRMRKRMMKKSTRLVRRIVKTHHSTISQLFSHSRSTNDRKRSSPLDQHLHERLEFHLQQLTCILDAFAESAEQITERYQLLINA